MPRSRGWAASPDLLLRISEIILRDKPKLVVEAGSGISSLVIAYCLRKNGQGRLISLDHEEEYAQATRDNLMTHGLTDLATIHHAPLREYSIADEKWLWYDQSEIDAIEPIDLLIIDGPPEPTQKMARYPALPLLNEKIRPGGLIILDDGDRPDEQAIMARWQLEHEEWTSTYLDLEKGAFVARKKSSVVPASP